MRRNHPRSWAVGAVVVAVAGGGLAVVTSAQAATGCQVAYSVSSQWQGGFGASVSITNLGSPITGWQLAWSFTAGQTITQLWNGSFTQSGSNVTVSSLSYNGSLATGGSTSFGFNGAWNGSNPVPGSFALNGVTCTGSVSSGSASPSTSASASASASSSPSSSASSSSTVATPQRLYATNGATSITLSWTEPATDARPAYFNVYEGGVVVARNTTTHVTIRNLVFNSAHTYTVTAVDSAGRESAPSAAISRTAFEGGAHACGITAPSGLVASDVTGSAFSLSWSNVLPSYDEAGTLVVLLDGVSVAQTNLDSIRISGLAPASTHSVAVARRDCSGTLHTSTPLTVTTPPGPSPRSAAPSGLTVTGTTNTSVSLSWTASGTAAGYAVYDGGARVAVTTGTTATVAGLWRDTGHQFTVSALDAAGAESAQSGSAFAATTPCDTVTPVPVALAVTPRSASTVALSWASTVQSTGFVVYRSGIPVATVQAPSAVITGLPSASTAQYSVAVQAAATGGACPTSAPSSPASATTLPGPAARPAAPTMLAVTGQSASYSNTGTITLAWSQPAGSDPVAGYRLYDGATVLASTTTTGMALTLPSGPTHLVYAVSVDAAGNESALDGPVSFTVPYIPVP